MIHQISRDSSISALEGLPVHVEDNEVPRVTSMQKRNTADMYVLKVQMEREGLEDAGRQLDFVPAVNSRHMT